MYLSKVTAQITRLGRSLFLTRWFRCSVLRDVSSLLTGITIFFIPVLCASAAQNISLSSDQDKATAGYFQLQWQGSDDTDTIYIVEETPTGAATPRVIYKGKDTATVISGKSDGQYLYQIHTSDGKHISNQLTVTVAHHSLTTAFNFFTIGAIVFIFILLAILRGNKQAVAKP